MHFASKSAQVWCQGATCSSQLTRVSPRPLSWQGLPPRAASTCPVGAYAVASSQRQRPGFRPTPPTHTTQGPSPGPTHFPPPQIIVPLHQTQTPKPQGSRIQVPPSPTQSTLPVFWSTSPNGVPHLPPSLRPEPLRLHGAHPEALATLAALVTQGPGAPVRQPRTDGVSGCPASLGGPGDR